MSYKHVMKNSEEKQAYDRLVEHYLCLDSETEVARLGNSKLDLSYVFKDFHKQLEAFKQKISQVSISVFIATWARIVREDKVYGIDHLKMMCDLVEAKLLPLVSLNDFVKIDSFAIIESIRCLEDKTISRREDIVLLYTSFISWLSKETFAYVPEALDLDRIVSQKRQVSFKTYINILEHLDLRERILAKMFYLGGNRSFEEVLSVQIENIDFKKGRIRFAEDVSYPRHLFEDIKKHMQSRKSGYLFMGKEGERISHTTPFRALKKVVANLKLDPEFTFRELTENV